MSSNRFADEPPFIIQKAMNGKTEGRGLQAFSLDT